MMGWNGVKLGVDKPVSQRYEHGVREIRAKK